MSHEEQSRKPTRSRSDVGGLVTALRFYFPHENVSATARLLDRDAPHTCDVIVATLPHRGEAFHGEYSGEEVFTLLPGRVHAPAENSTTKVNERDIGFLRFRGGTDVVEGDEVVSEIAWFYGNDAVPSMKDGPIELNIFARFEREGWEAFAAVCRKLKPEQAHPIIIEAIEETEEIEEA